MQDYKQITKDLKASLKKMKELNAKVLNEIQTQEPEKVAEIMKDHSKIFKAIDNRDVDSLNKLYKKYADQNTK